MGDNCSAEEWLGGGDKELERVVLFGKGGVCGFVPAPTRRRGSCQGPLWNTCGCLGSSEEARVAGAESEMRPKCLQGKPCSPAGPVSPEGSEFSY